MTGEEPPGAGRVALTATQARRRLLVLTATRWTPTGLLIGLTVLVMLQRGLSLTEVGVVTSVQGFVVLALELPTGGLADVLGRRPVLVLAALVGTVSAVVVLLAHDVAAFVAAAALQGVHRALDSGPVEAWYVDTARADDPSAPVERALAAAGTVLGAAIATGALLSGGLVAWAPLAGASPLLLPLLLAAAGTVGHLVGVALLVREAPPVGATGGRVWRSVAGTPAAVAEGVRTLRRDPVLRALVAVEVFWSVAMIGFETFTPVRLAELVGGEDRAGALVGPVSAAGWGLFALGSVTAGLVSRRAGVGVTALLARVLNGAAVVVMGLAAGPAGLVTAFLVAYALHGAAGPMHSALLHRQAGPGNRATVLSMNSMVAGGVYSLGLLVLAPLAQHTSTATAIVVAGAFSVLGAVLYLPAIRAERTATGDRERSVAVADAG